MGNFFNPVVGGIMDGAAIAQQIRRSALEQQQLELQQRQQRDREAQQQRSAQVQDIAQQMLLQQNGRPVQGGAVEDTMTAPGILGPTQTSFLRPPDSKRTVKYKTAAGDTLQYELMTPEEQLQRRVHEADALGTAGNLRHLELLKAENDANRVQLPGIGPVSPHAVSYYTELERERTQREIDAANNKRAGEIAAANRASAERRTADTNASRERAAALRGGRKSAELTPGQAGVQARADEKELQDLQDQEEDLHTMRGRLGAAIAGGKNYIDEKGKRTPLNDETKDADIEDMKQRFEAAAKKVKRVIADKNKVILRMGGKPLISTKAAHAKIDAGTEALLGGGETPSGPQKGDKQTYQGATYVFDGKEYVKQ